jgi:hypothetical protein
MPPLQALAALHGLWLLVLLPPAMWAACRWPAPRLRLLGSTLVAFVTLGFAMLAAREAATWLPTVTGEQARYLPHRILYVVATLTDVPLLQLTLAGTVCWVAGHLRGARCRVVSAGPDPASPKPAAVIVSLDTPSSSAPTGIPLADDAPPQRLPEPSSE